MGDCTKQSNHFPLSCFISRSGEGPSSLTNLEPSYLPVSGLSSTSEIVNQWCCAILGMLRSRYGSASLCFHMWPFRLSGSGPISAQGLSIVSDDNSDNTTILNFTAASRLASGVQVDEGANHEIRCLVPDFAEAMHITGILANELNASLKLFGQETDDNPITWNQGREA